MTDTEARLGAIADWAIHAQNGECDVEVAVDVIVQLARSIHGYQDECTVESETESGPEDAVESITPGLGHATYARGGIAR